MLDRLMAWVKEDRGELSGTKDALQLAVAALLIEAGHVDGRFEAAERAVIERLLERRFGLSPADGAALVATAERRVDGSAQLFGFVRTINERLSPEQRVDLIEMLWEVAYADGVLDPLEDALLRRIGALIDVSDHERGAAKTRVLRRQGMD